MKHKLTLLAAALCASPAFAATTWTTTIDAATYLGSTGSITFNDWGYTGPTGSAREIFRWARASTPPVLARFSTW